MSSFVKQGDVRQERFDWGTIGWRLTPDKGSEQLVIMDVTLEPGDSVFLDAGVIHASFNESDETAHLQVVIGPSLGGETGYGLEDVSGEEPWSSLRR